MSKNTTTQEPSFRDRVIALVGEEAWREALASSAANNFIRAAVRLNQVDPDELDRLLKALSGPAA
jgi:hypothetical protein